MIKFNSNVKVIYGTGDIMMNCTEKMDDGRVEVHIEQVEQGEIGSKQRENHNIKTTADLNSQIILSFNKIESVKALIEQLENAIEYLS